MPHNGIFNSEEIQAFVSRPLYNSDIIRSKNASYPGISVIIPSYNQAQFLEKTILSILNQNYPNTELIIMDGKSNDGSVEIIKKYESYISYWVSEPDNGQSSAINRGFAKATGDLIGWQNSDDIYLPGFFHAMADNLRKHPQTELFIGNVYIIDENDNITWSSNFIPFSINHLIYFGWNLSSQAAFVNRQIVKEVGPLRENIQVEFDWDWFIRVGKIAKHIVLDRRYGGCYRMHSTSKFMTYEHESRWPIESQILRSHGIKVREGYRHSHQRRWKTLLFKLRVRFYTILLYSSKPILNHLRRLIIWYLARYGIICKGFEV